MATKKIKPHDELRRLLETTPRISQPMAAKILAHVTRRPVSLRAVEAWLMKPGASDAARPTPLWTIDIFRDYRSGKIKIDLESL